jgi:CheY-like chemotaxis protein
MVFGFIKQSGGYVSARSTAGQGTTIRLYLPRTTRITNPHRDPALIPQADNVLGNKLVLVVEDETRLRKVAIELLQQLGLRALGAANADAALQYLKEFPSIDLLFTDLELGHGMNGFELAEEAKPLHPAIPVVFTTGHAQDAVYRQRRFQDATPVLLKLYSRQALTAQIKASLTSTIR